MKSGATAIDFGSQPCDICGGGTYTFPSGSIWCPLEDPHPGGHFVKRSDGSQPLVRKPRAKRVIQSVTDSDDVIRHDPIHTL